MRMARILMTEQEKLKEGIFLKERFKERQIIEPDLTVESLAHEMHVTQGLVSNYFAGKKPIPINRIPWLATRLKFHTDDLRPGFSNLIPIASNVIERRAAIEKIVSILESSSDHQFDKILQIVDLIDDDKPSRRDKPR